MKEKAISALISVFPTIETYQTFSQTEGSGKILRSLLEFAVITGATTSNNKEEFEVFLEARTNDYIEHQSAHKMTMTTLLDNKEDLLQTGLSGRGMVTHINALLDKFQIALPKITNTMLTRLKNEPVDTFHKQNVLRSMAFWLGFEKGKYDIPWNYLTLYQICRQNDRQVSAKEGVRIGFSLSSRGDSIENDIITWLKKNLKNYIKDELKITPFGNSGRIQMYEFTTLFIDFPKEESENGFSLYKQSLRDAISLAHQMAIRWALSPYASQKRFLAIGITIGQFSNLDNYLLPILNAKLPGDPVIRISDYARQCLLISDIRTIFNDKPQEIALFNGENLNIWWIVGLWSWIYWQFIPDLLKDEVLSNPKLFKRNIGNEQGVPNEGETTISKGMTALLKFPDNLMLGTEIAKTLYYRGNLREAIDVLKIVISTDPTNLNARSLRMVIFRNLASNAISPTVARSLFRQAEKEAVYILSNCKSLSEDFYDEYAVVKLTQAIVALRHLRQNRGKTSDFENDITPKHISRLLDEAEDLFEIAISVSPEGIRSQYLLICLRMLKRILVHDNNIYTDHRKSISIPIAIARTPAMDIFYSNGWLDETYSAELQQEDLLKILLVSFQRHERSVSLNAYLPTIYFCQAAVLWDFFPTRTIACARRTIRLLKEAIGISEFLEKENLHIYSYTRLHGEMMSATDFIKQLRSSIAMIQKFIDKKDGHTSSQESDKENQCDDNDQFLLFTHHID